MKCRFCKDKATKSIDVTQNQNFGVDDDEVFFREETTVYDSQGSFRPWVGGEDKAFSMQGEEEPGDEEEEEKAEVYVCEDHHRLWELLYGDEVEEEGIKPEEQEELEEATQKHLDEIEQIKERIRKKNQEK